MNFNKHKFGYIFTLLSVLLTALLYWSGAYDSLEKNLYDYRFKLRGPISDVRDNETNVVLVEIDDESYRLIPESYPYSRGRVWANVIRNLTDAGSKVIVFDIMFDAPDHTSKIIENYLTEQGNDNQ